MAFLTLVLLWGHFSESKAVVGSFLSHRSRQRAPIQHTRAHTGLGLVGGAKLSKCRLPRGTSKACHCLIWIPLSGLDDRTFAGHRINQSCCAALRQDIRDVWRDGTTIRTSYGMERNSGPHQLNTHSIFLQLPSYRLQQGEWT